VLTISKIKFPSWVKKTYHLIFEFIDRIDSHHIFLLSSAVSFNVLLYFVPLILVGIYITNLFLNLETFNSLIAELLLSFLPDTEQTYSIISNLLLETNKIFSVSSFVGLVGIISLLWLSSTVFSSLRSCLNVVFEAKATKIFVIYRVKDIALTILLTIFILLLGYALPLISILNKAIADLLPTWLENLFNRATVQIIGASLYFIFFFFVYKFIPNKKIPLKIVLTSSVFCTIFVELSREFFSYYVKYIANYSRIYGAYGFFVAVLVWVYYLFFIILFSGELSVFIFSKRINKGLNVSDKVQADE
jgi:membrane protein